MLDYAGPHEFAPNESTRGVGEHPHRGFETVTIVYQGELEHRDSSGSHGVIGPGDVQLAAHKEWLCDLPDGHTAMIIAQLGGVRINESLIMPVELAVLDREGTQFRVDTETKARILVITGGPIGKPVVGQGPFVMNTREEIVEAIQDYRQGRMGNLS